MYSKGERLSAQLRTVIPSGAHAYAKAANQWPEHSPKVLSHGKGAWVWDIDGNRYVDWFTGLTSVSLGHAYPTVLARVQAQLEHGNNFQLPTQLEYEAATLFLQQIAKADMVKFAKDGSTANDAAIRLARAYTGRPYIAKCKDHPFFSSSDWFIGKTRCQAGILPNSYHHILDFSYNSLQSLECLFKMYPGEIAAVILEPVRFDPPQPGFLEGVREICTREGTLLIFDEIVTGMKYHLNGAQALFNIQSDLTTWGKGIANGFPLSALTGKRHIMELGDTTRKGQTSVFLLSSTHGAEGSALAAMMATVEAFISQNIIDHNYLYGQQLREQAISILAELHLSDVIRFCGYDCFLSMKFYDSDKQESRALKTLFIQELIRNGVLFRGIFYVTLSHRDAELERTLMGFRHAAEVYCRALEDGVDQYLVGSPITPLL